MENKIKNKIKIRKKIRKVKSTAFNFDNLVHWKGYGDEHN